MKKLLLSYFIVSTSFSFGQFSLSFREVPNKQSLPRFSWNIPLLANWSPGEGYLKHPTLFSPWETNHFILSAGFEIQNSGLCCRDTGYVFKYGGTSAGPILSLKKQFFVTHKVGEDWKFRHLAFNYTSISLGSNFYFYCKEKIFPQADRKNAILLHRGFSIEKLNNPDLYIRISAGAKDLYSFYAEYHFQPFFNRLYETNDGGVITHPFADYRPSSLCMGVRLDPMYATGVFAGLILLIGSLMP